MLESGCKQQPAHSIVAGALLLAGHPAMMALARQKTGDGGLVDMRAALLAGSLLFTAATMACDQSTLPHAFDDRAFWALSESLSEPAGSFPLSDNLVSNEPRLAENARWIRQRGGVYI